MNKNNIIVCSKNRSDKDTTPSVVNVSLNTPLKCGDNEYFTVSVSSFNMIKSFYNIQTGLNSVFYIILKNQSNPTEIDEFIRSIPNGNYNVNTLLKVLKDITFGLLNVDYDKILNKFRFTRDLTNQNTVGYDLYLRCTNCGSVLGFIDGEEKLITEEGLVSDTFANISGYSSLLIKLDGLSLNNSYINLNDNNYDISKLLAIVDIASISPMDSIIYNGNNDDCSKYKISDKIIKQFSINIVNENNEMFPQMSDYILNLVFEKHTNNMDINTMFNLFMKRFDDLIYYITYLFQYLGVGGTD